MKIRLGLLAPLALACVAGSPARAETAAAEVKAAFVDPDSPDVRSVRTTGEYAIDRLVMTMVTDAAGAVSRHTEVAALPTFHLKDVPMKNGTVAGLPRITALKLTSTKLRNPTNAPDAADKLALDKVQADLERGDPPRILVQQITLPGGGTEWRVYKPLANIRQCGTCHAPPEDQAPELRAALQQRYPNDQSSSYAKGEWRGLIRVTVAEPAAAAASATAGPSTKKS